MKKKLGMKKKLEIGTCKSCGLGVFATSKTKFECSCLIDGKAEMVVDAGEHGVSTVAFPESWVITHRAFAIDDEKGGAA